MRKHHVLANHNKVKTRLSLLKHGWLFKDLGQTLKSLEGKCARCRVCKAKSNNKTTNIHINSSGRSYNLGMLSESADGHTMSLDAMGPIYGENDKKFWLYLFFSHNSSMVFTMLTDELTALNLHLCVNLLTSYIGKITLLISDQGAAFQPYATNLEMEKGEEEWEEIQHRKLRNPLARLLQDAPKEGKTDQISWKICGAHSGEFCGEKERFVGFFKQIMLEVDFHQKCKHFNYLQMSSAFATIAKTLNSRPILKTKSGQIFSPYDIQAHTLVGGGYPSTELRFPTTNDKLISQLSNLAKLKREIQESIFLHFSKLLLQTRDWRQRGNFAFHSQGLEPGDIILLNEAFALTKNLSNSLRRVAYLDTHRRHGIVYHLISPNRKFDLQDFEKQYKSCKTKNEKQLCVQQFLGRFSFQSVDLRHCSFIAKGDSEGNIDIFAKEKQDSRPKQLHTGGALNVGELHNKLVTTEGSMSASLPTLPQDLLDLSKKYKFQNNRKWDKRGGGQQQREEKDDCGDKTNRFQDHSEKMSDDNHHHGSRNVDDDRDPQDEDRNQNVDDDRDPQDKDRNQNDNDDRDPQDEDRNQNDEDDKGGQTGQTERPCGEKQVKTRRGRIVRKPNRFAP